MNYSRYFYESVTSRAEKAAQKVVDLTLPIFNPKSILDIGCGDGIWTSTFLKAADNINGVAVDLPGSSFELLKPFAQRTKLYQQDFELSTPPIAMIFDLTICVEVVEHISSNAAENLMDFISTNSRILIFSGATPGQGGTHHINERQQTFWIESMKKRGFEAFDVVRPVLFNIQDVPSYYKNNIFLYLNTRLLSDSEYAVFRNDLNQLLNFNFKDCRTPLERFLHSVLRRINPNIVSKLAEIKSKIHS